MADSFKVASFKLIYASQDKLKIDEIYNSCGLDPKLQYAGRLAGQAVGRQAGTWGHLRRFPAVFDSSPDQNREPAQVPPPRNNTEQSK